MTDYMIQIGDQVREMTDAEIEALKQARADNAEIHEALTALSVAKTSGRAKLKALGLTETEISALVG